MVFNATFNTISAISWRSVLLVEKTGVPGENHRPVANHWQTLSHKVASSTPRLKGFELTTLVAIGTDLCISSYKSNYHTITTTTAHDYITLKWRKCSNGKTEKFYKKNYNTMWLSYIHIIRIRIRIFIIPINGPTIGANKLHTLIIVIGGNYTYIYIYIYIYIKIYKYNVSCRVQSLKKD